MAAVIEYVGGQVALIAASTSSTTIVFNLTGGVSSVLRPNDIVVVSYAVSRTSDLSIGVLTTGYTEIAELYANNPAGDDCNLSVSWKRMGATPDTSVLVSASSIGSACVVLIHVYRGVDATTALDVTSTTATALETNIINPPAITPVTAGSRIVAIGMTAGAGTGDTLSASYLSNFIQGRNSSSLAGAGDVAWTSGAYDPAAWTTSASTSVFDSAASVTLALRRSNNEVVYPTGVSATASVNGAYVYQNGVMDLVGYGIIAGQGPGSAFNLTFNNLQFGISRAPWAGDVVVIHYGVASFAPTTPAITTAGYTSLPVVSEVGSASSASLTTAYTRMGATPATSAGLSSLGTANSYVIAVQVFRGVSATNPLDGYTQSVTDNTARPNPAAITPTTGGAIVAAMGLAGHNAGTQTFTSSDLSLFVTAGFGDTTYDGTGGAGIIRWTSGQVNPAQFGFSTTDSNIFSSVANTLAFAPAQGPSTSFSVVGVAATGAVGSVEVLTDSVIDVTGVSATGEVGAVLFPENIDVDVTGVSATGEVGEVTTDVTTDVLVVGLEATGAVGSVEVFSNIDVDVTGVSATGEVGEVTATGGQTLDVVGVSATGEVGELTVTGTADIEVSGLEAQGSVGDVVASIPVDVEVSGVAGNGQVGAVETSGTAFIDLIGVQASALVGSVEVLTESIIDVTGVSATGEVGDVTIALSQVLSVTGLSALTALDGVQVFTSSVITPTGVVAQGRVGIVLVWGRIIPSTGQTWAPIQPGAILLEDGSYLLQEDGLGRFALELSTGPLEWNNISPASGGVWSQISPAPPSSWTSVTPTPDNIWTEIDA